MDKVAEKITPKKLQEATVTSRKHPELLGKVVVAQVTTGFYGGPIADRKAVKLFSAKDAEKIHSFFRTHQKGNWLILDPKTAEYLFTEIKTEEMGIIQKPGGSKPMRGVVIGHLLDDGLDSIRAVASRKTKEAGPLVSVTARYKDVQLEWKPERDCRYMLISWGKRVSRFDHQTQLGGNFVACWDTQQEMLRDAQRVARNVRTEQEARNMRRFMETFIKIVKNREKFFLKSVGW